MLSIIKNLDYLENIQKIEIQSIPNQFFNVYVDNFIFDIEIRTYNSNRSTLTLYENANVITNEAPFIVNMNFLFYSCIDNLAFFFLTSKNLNFYNYENLGKEINLYCARVLQEQKKDFFSFKDIQPYNKVAKQLKDYNRAFGFETKDVQYNANCVSAFFNSNFTDVAEI